MPNANNRCRSACTSVQSDQPLCYSLPIAIDDIPKISRLQLASVAELTGLSPTWSHSSEDSFSHVVAHL